MQEINQFKVSESNVRGYRQWNYEVHQGNKPDRMDENTPPKGFQGIMLMMFAKDYLPFRHHLFLKRKSL